MEPVNPLTLRMCREYIARAARVRRATVARPDTDYTNVVTLIPQTPIQTLRYVGEIA